MRAWALEQQARIEQLPLKLLEVPAPHPSETEVRIRVVVCGVCRTDLHIAEGDLPLKKSPVILGHEVVGFVDEAGKKVRRFSVGDKAGVYWLHSSCGKCKYCLSGRENYCPGIKCTGWDENGGYAEYLTVSEDYAIPLNSIQLEPAEIAPLLCPGIAGYAALRLAEAQKGGRLGLHGFGPTAHCVPKIAQSMGERTARAPGESGQTGLRTLRRRECPANWIPPYCSHQQATWLSLSCLS